MKTYSPGVSFENPMWTPTTVSIAGDRKQPDDLDGCSVRLRHPLRNENRIALLRAERQMTSAAMHLIGDNKGGLPE